MEGGGAYGAAKAGGTFDLGRFVQQPQVLARIASAVFALIVFACLLGEGYTNLPSSPQLFCIFNHNEDACRYGIGIGILAFLACIFFFMVDIYFPQISNTTDRKYLVLADLSFSGTGGCGAGLRLPWLLQWLPLSRDVAASAWRRESLPPGTLPTGHALPAASAPRSSGVAAPGRAPALASGRPDGSSSPVGAGSGLGTCLGAAGRSPSPSRHLPPAGLWTFLWFIGFCFLTNQWAWTQAKDVHIGADSARAAITFSFFSIFSWGLLIAFAYKRYKMGVEDFSHSYVDPTPEVPTPYSSYPNISHDSYQQPPFTHTAEAPGGYQPPPVY
ncbi:hypothetical protein QYF61_022974 [Mycteria americana]|uniref:MARVEL domain-containing protein n=1 Tax=Mycteria americana TaxID=33587 RepID=A0AAN7MLI7_MYCAM|nr:hypothetical protein QYF61_022974 [Mycteria americana]